MTGIKPKQCKFCKVKFEPSKQLQQVCSPTCAFQLARINGQKEFDKQTKIKRKELKEGLKTKTWYLKSLQAEINRIVRLIDHECNCISSGKKFQSDHQAGHYFTTQGWPELRFNLLNIWIQSVEDNMHRSGNQSEYAANLHKFGILELVLDLRVQYKGLRFSIDELKEFITTAKNIVKELNELNKTERTPRSLERRLELRKTFNHRIGIYT